RPPGARDVGTDALGAGPARRSRRGGEGATAVSGFRHRDGDAPRQVAVKAELERPVRGGARLALAPSIMRTSFAYLALLALAGGCGTYRVNRSALAPRPTPAMHSGHPLDGVVELAGGLSSVSHLTEPSVGNPDSGVEVAGTQVRG